MLKLLFLPRKPNQELSILITPFKSIKGVIFYIGQSSGVVEASQGKWHIVRTDFSFP